MGRLLLHLVVSHFQHHLSHNEQLKNIKVVSWITYMFKSIIYLWECGSVKRNWSIILTFLNLGNICYQWNNWAPAEMWATSGLQRYFSWVFSHFCWLASNNSWEEFNLSIVRVEWMLIVWYSNIICLFRVFIVFLSLLNIVARNCKVLEGNDKNVFACLIVFYQNLTAHKPTEGPTLSSYC